MAESLHDKETFARIRHYTITLQSAVSLNGQCNQKTWQYQVLTQKFAVSVNHHSCNKMCEFCVSEKSGIFLLTFTLTRFRGTQPSDFGSCATFLLCACLVCTERKAMWAPTKSLRRKFRKIEKNTTFQTYAVHDRTKVLQACPWPAAQLQSLKGTLVM